LPRAGGGVGGALATTGRFGTEAEAGWGTRGLGEELEAGVARSKFTMGLNARSGLKTERAFCGGSLDGGAGARGAEAPGVNWASSATTEASGGEPIATAPA